MSLLRRLPTPRLVALVAGICVALAGGTALAAGALEGAGPKPPAKPLASALHDAATAPAVSGVTARIRFTNKLIDSSSIGGGAGPLLSGATGRLWASRDGRLRLELQGDRGDVQIVSDGKGFTLLDSASNTAYELTLPAGPKGQDAHGTQTPPTLAAIKDFLGRFGGHADVSGATPDNVAGREAYSVKVSPARDGGMIGAAELAFDAVNGTPLRAAVYAAGNPSPVLELTATDISFGPVSDADLTATPPAHTKVVKVDLSGGGSRHADGAAPPKGSDVTGPSAVGAPLPFALKAPDTLSGLQRAEVRLVGKDATKQALVTYGKGLGTVAILEQLADTKAPAATKPGEGDQLSLPTVSINGADGQELATALGTLLRFQRDGVQYTIVGSVPPAVAEAAGRGL